jgi:hypothetical protein
MGLMTYLAVFINTVRITFCMSRLKRIASQFLPLFELIERIRNFRFIEHVRNDNVANP